MGQPVFRGAPPHPDPMKPNPDPRQPIPGELTPEDLALLADYQDGALSPGQLPELRALLARSDAAREVAEETSELLGRRPESETGSNPWSETPSSKAHPLDSVDSHGGPDPSPEPVPRMGWRSFLPLAAAGVGVIVLLFLPKGEPLDLQTWSEQLSQGDPGDPFPFPVLRGGVASDGVAQTVGVRWVDLRIALATGHRAEVDSLARILAEDLRDIQGTGPSRARLLELAGADLPSSAERVDATEGALIEAFGPDFEEAVVLATLRRAAGGGASRLARTLVRHPALADGEGVDIDEGDLTRLVDLCEGSLTPEELTEMEAIVTGILRSRT